MNTPVLLFAFVGSTIVGITFGLFPALKSSNVDVQTGLKEGSRSVAGGHPRAQQVLVVLQIALAAVLLTGGSLLFRTIRNLWAVNPGFNPQHVITFQVGLSPAVTNTPSRMRIAYQQLVERIRPLVITLAGSLTASGSSGFRLLTRPR